MNWIIDQECSISGIESKRNQKMRNLALVMLVGSCLPMLSQGANRPFFYLPSVHYQAGVPSLAGALYCQMIGTKFTEIEIKEAHLPSGASDFKTWAADQLDFVECQQKRPTVDDYYHACRFSSNTLNNGPVSRTLVQVLRQLWTSGSYCDSPVEIQSIPGYISASDGRFHLNCRYTGDIHHPSTAQCMLR
jgi:hypothetical protein